MSERPPVEVAREGEIAVVTIARPERRNALDSHTARSLIDAVTDLSPEVRVIILTGAGSAFCAGGDLDELERWSTLAPEEVGATLYGAYQGMVRAIRSSSAVVIAAINGAAVGAGLDLALACDLRIASRDAKLGQVWVRLGLIPGTGGAWLTQAMVGPTKATEMLLTGETLDADDALAAGLVNTVVEPADLLDAARALAARILIHPKDGVVANKRALVAASEPAFEAALAHAALVQPGRFTSEEFKQALRAARG